VRNALTQKNTVCISLAQINNHNPKTQAARMKAKEEREARAFDDIEKASRAPFQSHRRRLPLNCA